MTRRISEERFERAFAANLRGDLVRALLLFEESFLADPSFELALLNYARTLRVLKLGEKIPAYALRLASEATDAVVADADASARWHRDEAG